jgi:DNA-binding NarL/FixJ family response regulator
VQNPGPWWRPEFAVWRGLGTHHWVGPGLDRRCAVADVGLFGVVFWRALQMSDKLRILIVDDHALVRKGVASLVQERDSLEICGEAANGEEGVQKAIELRPDFIILDVTMPVLNGLEAARRIRAHFAAAPILMLSMHDSPQMIEEAKMAGAQGFLRKSEVAEALLEAIDTLVEGHTFFSGSAIPS